METGGRGEIKNHKDAQRLNVTWTFYDHIDNGTPTPPPSLLQKMLTYPTHDPPNPISFLWLTFSLFLRPRLVPKFKRNMLVKHLKNVCRALDDCLHCHVYIERFIHGGIGISSWVIERICQITCKLFLQYKNKILARGTRQKSSNWLLHVYCQLQTEHEIENKCYQNVLFHRFLPENIFLHNFFFHSDCHMEANPQNPFTIADFSCSLLAAALTSATLRSKWTKHF